MAKTLTTCADPTKLKDIWKSHSLQLLKFNILREKMKTGVATAEIFE